MWLSSTDGRGHGIQFAVIGSSEPPLSLFPPLPPPPQLQNALAQDKGQSRPVTSPDTSSLPSSSPPPPSDRGSFSHAKFPICRDLDAPLQTLSSLPLSIPPSLALSSLSLSSRVTSSVSRTTTSYSAFLMIAAGRADADGRAAHAWMKGANRSSGGRRDGRTEGRTGDPLVDHLRG